ncbi:glycosyltransferase [Pseudoalteromonas sp. A22]|uniref:glycosyltransferase n=1 Tax=Pseudoalteromonas sp. A22 TaxID=327511 RepID=UPI001BAB35A4|nr:glycosyltransferase [Pseudoalteromonas sp. A22]QUI62433.1 glycosyltransferase [Pseudoalteromonas sp. A22]
MKESLKFSVVISVYNDVVNIEDALKSVFSQSFKSYELIVIDGGSNDGTFELLDKYKSRFTYFISEKDSGISEAWNKGLAKAEGDFVVILNSDDYWPPNYLESISAQLPVKEKRKALFYGNTQMVMGEEKTKLVCKKYIEPFVGFLGFRFMHTSLVASKEVYTMVGEFNTSVRIAIDTEWLMRARMKNIKFLKLNHTNYMREGGVSDLNQNKAFSEFLYFGKSMGFLKLPTKFYLKVRDLIVG